MIINQHEILHQNHQQKRGIQKGNNAPFLLLLTCCGYAGVFVIIFFICRDLLKRKYHGATLVFRLSFRYYEYVVSKSSSD